MYTCTKIINITVAVFPYGHKEQYNNPYCLLCHGIVLLQNNEHYVDLINTLIIIQELLQQYICQDRIIRNSIN